MTHAEILRALSKLLAKVDLESDAYAPVLDALMAINRIAPAVVVAAVSQLPLDLNAGLSA